MAEEPSDTRPEYEPTFFMYEPLPANPEDGHGLVREMSGRMIANGATWARMTVVNSEYENPPYPHGFYLEGWAVDPALRDPPGKQAPFNFPLVAVDPDSPPT